MLKLLKLPLGILYKMELNIDGVYATINKINFVYA